MAPPRLDIIIYGASGFTGKVAVLELTKLLKDYHITWGVAGRSVSKLKEVLADVSKKTGENVNNVPVIIADTNNEKALGEMASRAKVVVNCVGPYRFFGEPVVKACIANGAHHVDVSGEPEYMESIQLNYNKEAEEKGVYIISACGFDSIPADLGLLYFIDKFNGEVNSVETYLEFSYPGNIKGAVINYGTYETAVCSIENMHKMRSLRQNLFPEPLPKLTPKLKARPAIHKSELMNKWCLPFMGSDRSVMYRSQRYLYETEKKRPVQVQTYIGFSSLFRTILVTILAGIAFAMAKLSFTRNLLLQYPGFFTAGWVSRKGPSEETMRNTVFSITFFGEGWTEQKPVEEGHSSPPNKTMITKVSGTDPAYGFTTRGLLLSAITILKESDEMPGKGGVLTTVAFAKTSLMRKLENAGLKFEVIKEEVINDTS